MHVKFLIILTVSGYCSNFWTVLYQDLVQFVEETVRIEHALSPKKPIYLVGDSFGGCLALAVAARNPTVDLVIILANPGHFSNSSMLYVHFRGEKMGRSGNGSKQVRYKTGIRLTNFYFN